MKKTSIASLQERLAGWTDWDLAMYHIGACLGFWPEFGAPVGEDQWNHVKGIIWSANPLGDAISNFIVALSKEGCLERRDEPDIAYRWSPNYKGSADVISTL
jgi:hypothetical protein